MTNYGRLWWWGEKNSSRYNKQKILQRKATLMYSVHAPNLHPMEQREVSSGWWTAITGYESRQEFYGGLWQAAGGIYAEQLNGTFLLKELPV